jgi:hypothetical protein
MTTHRQPVMLADGCDKTGYSYIRSTGVAQSQCVRVQVREGSARMSRPWTVGYTSSTLP